MKNYKLKIKVGHDFTLQKQFSTVATAAKIEVNGILYTEF